MVQPILNMDATAIDSIAFLFEGDSEAIKSNCNGSISVETETQTKTKKCGGQTVAEVTKPTKMSVTVEAHIPVAIFRRFYGITQDEKLNKGVYSYGKTSKGERFAMAADVSDDFTDVHKLIAFLSMSSQNALTFTIDAAEDEVAMMELVATAYEDELGYWYHEAFESELEAPLTKDKWMTSLKADDLKKVGE